MPFTFYLLPAAFCPEPRTLNPTVPLNIRSGFLHASYAFDIGYEVDLKRVRQRLAAGEEVELPRRRRTPESIAYRPPPLRVPQSPASLRAAGTSIPGQCELVVFDFGSLSFNYRFPWSGPLESIRDMAAAVAAEELAQTARRSLAEVFEKIRDCVDRPGLNDLVEEYFVFHVAQFDRELTADELLDTYAPLIAGALRLEELPLSADEQSDALRLRISYSPHDLAVLDWAAAFLFDPAAEEILQILEFANVELLELRFLDAQLDSELDKVYRLAAFRTTGPRAWFHGHAAAIRALSELKVDATSVFERVDNTLKLVGDQYLARVYRLLAGRFHLAEWEQSVERKLQVVEDLYTILVDRSTTRRQELLEMTVVFLIVLEILLAFLVRGH